MLQQFFYMLQIGMLIENRKSGFLIYNFFIIRFLLLETEFRIYFFTFF